MLLIWSLRFACCGILVFALRKGEEPERMVATILIATILLDVANHALFGSAAYYAIDPGHFVIDSWALAGLLWVALRANRGWPLWACSGQVIVVLAHFAKIIDLSLVRYGYFAMSQLPFAIQSAALLLGTTAHLRRTGRIGRYHAWRLA